MYLKRSCIFLFFCLFFRTIVFSDEYLLSAIRSYRIYDDLKYLQTIESFNYSNRLLLERSLYQFHPVEGFTLRNQTTYTYNDNNIILFEQINNRGRIVTKNYIYNDNGMLQRTFYDDGNSFNRFLSTVNFRYEDNNIIGDGNNQSKLIYDLDWNLLLEETSFRRIVYSYNNNILENIEIYSINNNTIELIQNEYNVYNDNNQLIEKIIYVNINNEMVWNRKETYIYNSINELSTKYIEYNFETFDIVYLVEFFTVPYYDIIEYEYRIIE